MSLVEFVTEVIKCLSEFQADWKASKMEQPKTFAEWMTIFSKYAIKANEPF